MEKPISNLSHLDELGAATMVDVTSKEVTMREARAYSEVCMQAETLGLVLSENNKKGDILSVARIAGIQAAKKTADLIPLCHPLMLTSIKVEFEVDRKAGRIGIQSCCRLAGKTGVEMEALTAVSVAALTVYDMCKAIDKGIVVRETRLLEKKGGKGGHWKAG